jgi:5-methylcytosine-specific restriction endonuclease McrA
MLFSCASVLIQTTCRGLFIHRSWALHPQARLFMHNTMRTFINRVVLYPSQRALPFWPMTSTTENDPAGRMAMRAPCARCGCLDGAIATKNGQDTVRCADCNRYCYNAPRTETGRPRRSLRTRPDISPSQRTRILLRDNRSCVMCHSRERLEVAHIVSVRDGLAQKLSDTILYSDDNLVAMCAACNSGQSSNTVPAHRLLLILSLRAQQLRSQQPRTDREPPECDDIGG